MKGVAVHWTVTPARDDHARCEADWAGVIAQHQVQGYRPSPAYNWGVCQHGIRMTGRTWAIRSAANGTTESNRDYWAIVALNAPGDTPSDALLTGLADLIDEAPDLDSRTVYPHSHFYATACCGDELRAWIDAGAMSPTPPPLPPTQETGTVKYLDTPAQLNTFAVDGAGNLVTRWYNRDTGGPWGSFTLATGARPFASVDAGIDGTGRIDVFAEADAGQVHAWYPGDQWYSELLA